MTPGTSIGSPSVSIMRTARMIVVGLLASVVLLLGIAAPAHADVDDFTFDSMTVDYTLTRDEDGTSRLHVVEELVAVFPEHDQNRGIRRLLPLKYNGQPLEPELISVTDGEGNARPVEQDEADNALEIVSRAGDYLHGPQVYVITYTMENVTWDFPDTGLEFYWNVNGVDWAQPFGEVTARLHLDGELAEALSGRQACYAGSKDATTPCTEIAAAESDDGVVVTARADGLGPHETLTMAVGFDDGSFVAFDTSYLAQPASWVQAVAGVGALGALGLAVGTRRRRLRDEPGRPTIIAEYDPPRGTDALEAAVLLGRTSKAVPAEVLEQAVVGSIRIVEGTKLFSGRSKLTVELIDPSLADGNGRQLLDAMFPSGRPGEAFALGKQNEKVASASGKIVKQADSDLRARGLRKRVPVSAYVWPIAAAALAVVVMFVTGMIASDNGASPVLPIAMIVGGAAVLIGVIALVARRPLTAQGAELRDHLMGLKEFIGWAEQDRIRMLQSPRGAERVPVDANDPRQRLVLYERLLPYAVVFGQEKEWSAQLAVLYTAIGAAGPVWYYGTGAFNASSFASSVSGLSAAAASSSSTSGGSSGGGSAGGGGGGGGGGGV